MNLYQQLPTSHKTRFAAAALVASLATPTLVACTPAAAHPLSPVLAPVVSTVEIAEEFAPKVGAFEFAQDFAPVVSTVAPAEELAPVVSTVDPVQVEAAPEAAASVPDAPEPADITSPPVAVSVPSERLAKCESAPEFGPDDDALDIAVKFITAEEGFDKNWVDIGDGMWTIGYGHAIQKSESKDVTGPLTKADAAALLRKDLAEMKYVPAVDYWFDEDLNDVTYAMMVSFAYNAGPGGFSKYDIPKSDVNEIADAIEHASDHHAKKFPGLLCRRAREANLIRESMDATISM